MKGKGFLPMRRFRLRRRRAASLALLPAFIATLIAMPTATAAIGAEARQANIKPAKGTVTYGQRLVLRGTFPNSPNAGVEVLHRAAGKPFRKVATTRTGPDGGYAVRVKPRSSGHWRARLASTQRSTQAASAGQAPAAADTTSNSRRVRVRSLTSAKVSDKHTLAGGKIKIKGLVRPGGVRKIKVRTGNTTLNTRTSRHGRFSVRFKPRRTGLYTVRVRAIGNPVASKSTGRAGKVTVYRKAMASYYGPGFYGNRTACGQTLTPGTLGVAHKTMPCGTKLTLRNGGRSVKVRVIDRGPYHGNREFDLTEATKRRIGFGSTGYVWTSK